MRPCLLFLLLCVGAVSILPCTAQMPFGDLYSGLGETGIVVQAPRNYVTLSAQFREKYLVIKANIAAGWHLYSITQPDGGTLPAVFEFEQPELTLEEIRPTTEPHVNSQAVGFNVDLEEHSNTVTWIMTFQEPLPVDQPIKGTLMGQVCQIGEGGLCVPVTLSFDAVFDANLDTAPLLKQAEAVAERFVLTYSPRPDSFPLLNRLVSKPIEIFSNLSKTLDLDKIDKTWNKFWRVGNKSNGRVKGEGVPLSTAETFDVQETVNIGSFWAAIGFAFLGGIVLNFMPCVLPVIGLKILSFFEQANKSRARALLLNLCYALGILSVFLLLAFLSLGLSVLFTFDLFGIIMACVVFTMALSLMDIWTLTLPRFLQGKASEQLMSHEGVIGAFFKGIITTLLAIPCGAPFLSPAVNWADMQIRSGNMPVVFLMYGIIGIGMASPYILLGVFPEWLRFLPKPGPWMETFKKTMGFCLLLAVVWILYFVRIEKLLPTITLLFALWFVCWLIGEQQPAGKIKKRSYFLSLLVLGLVIFFSYQIQGIPNAYTLESAMRTRVYGHQGAHWQPYSRAALDSALSSNHIVLIDFTADWCVNCKILEAAVLHSETVLTVLDEKKIVSLTADCTRSGEATELLKQLGPEQVPTLVVFDPSQPNKPVVIRGMYTQHTLIETLKGKP